MYRGGKTKKADPRKYNIKKKENKKTRKNHDKDPAIYENKHSVEIQKLSLGKRRNGNSTKRTVMIKLYDKFITVGNKRINFKAKDFIYKKPMVILVNYKNSQQYKRSIDFNIPRSNIKINFYDPSKYNQMVRSLEKISDLYLLKIVERA